MDRVVKLSRQTLFWDEVENGYDAIKEFIRTQDYAKEVKLRKLKRSVLITQLIYTFYYL